MDFTNYYTALMASALFYAAMSRDSLRSKYEPFSAQECKTLAIDRVAEIRAHNKKIFSEVEEFAIYFYTEVDYEVIAEKCNKMLHDAWEYD